MYLRQKDPFEVFLDYKDRIGANRGLAEKLNAFSSAPRPLQKEQAIRGVEYLGAGPIHTHYRLGQVGRIWLATRESLVYDTPELKRMDAEDYIRQARQNRNKRHIVPRIVGGVSSPENGLFFLIVEDLTHGGNLEFFDHQNETGTVRRPGSNQGAIVHFDFHMDEHRAFTNPIEEKDYEFMLEGKMITI